MNISMANQIFDVLLNQCLQRQRRFFGASSCDGSSSLKRAMRTSARAPRRLSNNEGGLSDPRERGAMPERDHEAFSCPMQRYRRKYTRSTYEAIEGSPYTHVLMDVMAAVVHHHRHGHGGRRPGQHMPWFLLIDSHGVWDDPSNKTRDIDHIAKSQDTFM